MNQDVRNGCIWIRKCEHKMNNICLKLKSLTDLCFEYFLMSQSFIQYYSALDNMSNEITRVIKRIMYRTYIKHYMEYLLSKKLVLQLYYAEITTLSFYPLSINLYFILSIYTQTFFIQRGAIREMSGQ